MLLSRKGSGNERNCVNKAIKFIQICKPNTEATRVSLTKKPEAPDSNVKPTKPLG